MSSKSNTLAQEISSYYKQSLAARNEWFFVECMLQLVDREKILVMNRYRKAHDEPLIIPEPQRYKNVPQQHVGWIVDVPKPWVSLVSKDKQS